MIQLVKLFSIAVLSLSLMATANAQSKAGTQAIPGHSASFLEGWKLQSGCVEKSTGDRISSPEYRADAANPWLPALVPGTVLGAQVAAGVFRNPYFGMNLRGIPGTEYPIGKIFGYLPMSSSSPYRCPWWYRVEFTARPEIGRIEWLHFDGINYRANIWLNGKLIANSDYVAGAFRAYDFDITTALRADGRNVLAVEVFAQTEKDLGIDFLDWNPAPADKDMGLWRGVSLESSGAVTVRHAEVFTHFAEDDLSEAGLTIIADVANHTTEPVTATIAANAGGHTVSQSIKLGAMEARSVRFDPEHFAQLRWKNPPLWWPYQYGEPHLESLHLTARVNGAPSDECFSAFGIREVNSFLNKDGFRQFRINRRDILIRGAGWTPDLLYREPANRIEQELEYVRALRLNTIRLEGKMGSDALFDLADRMGILVIAGWQCCDYWQKTDKWNERDRAIAVASQESQISRLRGHASILAWLNGSDEAPVPSVEQSYLTVLKERDWNDPVLSAAADVNSPVSGKSGVKMTGPYDYVPPEYWYLDHDRFGGAYGFNMETSPGAAPPIASNIRRTLPESSWWPIDQQWKYHAALEKFAQYDSFTEAMDATYGKASSLDDFTLKAQLMAYDGERAMFEAYSARKYRATGVIQWMLNNAWPSFFWHLYDYYLVPGGGFFGTRKANEPLHIQYRYDDREICIVNATLRAHSSLHAKAQLLRLDGTVLSSMEATSSVVADGVADLFAIPAQSATTFLKLQLWDSKGALVSDNFYWLPAKVAEMNWDKTTYVRTPALHYTDMRDLHSLPVAELRVLPKPGSHEGEAEVEVYNPGKVIAFFAELRAVKIGTDEDIAPIFWSDNYVSLLPGERRMLNVSGLGSLESVAFKVSGWNVSSTTFRLSH